MGNLIRHLPGCGICTFVCPTCQCYDICDYDAGHEIRKFRCWDSCMYPGFTEMSHGNNRNSQMQRFRQRFMHKLVYFRKTTAEYIPVWAVEGVCANVRLP